MKKTSETIVFFGSGPVAARSLELLVTSFDIEAVVTKPRPPHHHGEVPVLEAAKKFNLRLIEASDRDELSFKISSENFLSRVGVLIDFGIIVPEKVISSFELGIVNSHFSLLPEWRGADPITFAILSGQAQTGVSLMLLVSKMDEGPLIAQRAYTVNEDETTPSLTTHLIDLSHTMLCETLPGYLKGKIEPESQAIAASKMRPPLEVSYSRKLMKEDGVLDWTRSAEVLEREVRAFRGWPKSRTEIAGIGLVITEAHVVIQTHSPGQAVISDKSLVIGTGHNALEIDSLIPAGKKEMSATAFLAGYGSKLKI